MKKTTSRILLSALTVLALLSLSGCAQEKEENTKQSDPQARRRSCNAARRSSAARRKQAPITSA